MAVIGLSVEQLNPLLISPVGLTLALNDLGIDESFPYRGMHGFQHKVSSGTG